MRKTSTFIFVLGLCLFITACNQQRANGEQITEQTHVITPNEQDSLMHLIDEEADSLSRVESLLYSKQDGSTMKVIAYLDQNNLITKIKEEKMNGKTGAITKQLFYANGGVYFASKKIYEKTIQDSIVIAEEITFYDEKGKALKTKIRTAIYEEYLAMEDFVKTKLVKHSKENAFLVLKQQGPYAITFQGFVDSGPYHFLIVGENVQDDGYTSALSIQQQNDPTINYLREEGKDALGKELLVKFQNHYDSQGYMMQILISVALVERK